MSEGKLKQVLNSVVTTAPYTIYQAGLLAWLVTGKVEYGFFTLLAVVMGDGFNAVEKKLAKLVMGPASVAGARPSGCGTRGCTRTIGCGIYPSAGAASHTWGMPSGHAQITTLSATFWTIYVWRRFAREKNAREKKKLKTKAIVSTIIIWLLALLVWAQRVYSGCHSMMQIGVGALIGAPLGLLGYFISAKMFKGIP